MNAAPRLSFRRLSFGALLLVATLATSGCASLSKGECLAQDWYSIGVRDGANGAGEERVLQHAESCAEHGTRPDRAAWEAGRLSGLERYCTVHRGLRAGEHGEHYGGGCGPAGESAFLHGYAIGRELADARGRVAWLDREIAAIERALDDEKTDKDERKRLRARLVQHEIERFRRQEDLRLAEARAASL
ncbi:MAG: DUF2799 domain-containing protein [Steroidobacteraceae bacterium]|jgi:hypothetical protein|nr:DUF2799 domain-containing protein [Steroidobacteraceae bacterium]